MKGKDIRRLEQFVLDITQEIDQVSLTHALLRSLGGFVLHGLKGVGAGTNWRLYEMQLRATDGQEELETWVAVELLDPRRGCVPASDLVDAGVLANPFAGEEHPVAQHGCLGRGVLYAVHLPGYAHWLWVSSAEIADQYDREIRFFLQLYRNQSMLIYSKEHDALTGLLNRRSFEDRIEGLLTVYDHGQQQRKSDARARLHGICLAMFDIDHFKRVNDQFGHLLGDEVLVLVARLISHSLRHTDMAFRLGGEEFVALLPDIDNDSAVSVLNRLRERIAAYTFPQVGRVTISIGFVTWDTPGDPPVLLVERADRALYYAKAHGRNQVCSYQQLVAAGELDPADYGAVDIEVWG